MKKGGFTKFLNRYYDDRLRTRTLHDCYRDNPRNKKWIDNGVIANIEAAVVETYDSHVNKKLEECGTATAECLLDALSDVISKMEI